MAHTFHLARYALTTALSAAMVAGCGAYASASPLMLPCCQSVLVQQATAAPASVIAFSVPGFVAGTGLKARTAFGGANPAGLSIVTRVVPSTRYVSRGQAITLSASVAGQNASKVAYTWSATAGTLGWLGSNQVVWTAPATPGDVNVQVMVNTGSEEAPGAYRFTVL